MLSNSTCVPLHLGFFSSSDDTSTSSDSDDKPPSSEEVVAALPGALDLSPLSFVNGDMYDDEDMGGALEVGAVQVESG